MKKIISGILALTTIMGSVTLVSAKTKEEMKGYSLLYENTFDNGVEDAVNFEGEGFELAVLAAPLNASFEGNNGVYRSGGIVNDPVFYFGFGDGVSSDIYKLTFDFALAGGSGNYRNCVIVANRLNDQQWKGIDMMHIAESFYFVKDALDTDGYFSSFPTAGTALDTNVHKTEIVMDLNNSTATYYIDGDFVGKQENFPKLLSNLAIYLQGDIKYFDNLSLEKYEELPMLADVSEKDGELVSEFTDGVANKNELEIGAVIKNLYTGEEINAEVRQINDFEAKLIPEKDIVSGIEYSVSFLGDIEGRCGGKLSGNIIFNTASNNAVKTIDLVFVNGETSKITSSNNAEINSIKIEFTEDVFAEDAISGLLIKNEADGKEISYTSKCVENTAEIILSDMMLGDSSYILSLNDFDEIYSEIKIKTSEGKTFMYEPVLVNEAGEEISEIPENSAFGVKLVFGNTSDEAKKYTASVSLYDGKSMADIKLSDIELLPGSKVSEIFEMSTEEISDASIRGAILNEDNTVSDFSMISFGSIPSYTLADVLGEIIQTGEAGAKLSCKTEGVSYIDVLKDGMTIDDITEENIKDILIFRDYTVSDDDGISTFEFELSKTDAYDVYVTDTEKVGEKIDFDFVNDGDFKALVEVLALMDENEINKILTDSHEDYQKALLGISDADVEDINTKDLAEVIKNTIESEALTDDRDEVWNIIDRAIFVQLLNESYIEDVMKESKNITKLDKSEVAEWFEKSYTEENAFQKEFTKRLSDKGFESYKEYEDAVLEAFVLATVKEPDGSGNVEDIIREFADEIGIDVSENEKTSVWTKLSGSDFDDFDDLAEGFEDAKNASSSKGNGGSSGGGSKKTSLGVTGRFVTEPVLNNDLSGKNESESKPVFNDIENVSWAKEAITFLSGRGIINGVSDGVFEPFSLITREQFVKIAVGAFVPGAAMAENKFSDVPDGEWYTDYIRKALAKGITNGMGNGEFGVGKPITRQDMCVMIYNAAKASGMELDSTENNTFSDNASIAEYAKEAVYALKNTGAVSGYGENDFRPLGNATRAEAAKIIYSLIK